MPSLSSVLFSTSCKADLLFYSFMVTKFFPVCCGSHFIWILVCLLCFNRWPMHYSDHAFIHVLLSIPAPACSRIIPFRSHDSSSFFCTCDSHILDFFCDSRAFKLRICYEPRPLGQMMFPKTWGIYYRTENYNWLRKFIVQILMLAEVLE